MAKPSRLVRQFSFASLIAVLLVAFALASFHAWKAQSALAEQGERKNAAQVRLLLNQLDTNERSALDALLQTKERPTVEAPAVKDMLQIFARSVTGTTIVKLKLYNTSGLTVFSSETRQIGEERAGYPGFVAALDGVSTSQLSLRESFESFFGTLHAVAVIGTYLPIRDSASKVVGVIEVYDDVTDLLATISRNRWEVFGLSAVLMSALYVALLLIVQRADRIVVRNEEALEHEASLRARIASEAKRSQQATEKAQRETEKAYAAARIARRAAEDANLAKSGFIGKLSGEMRAPLNGLIGTTDVLLMGQLSQGQRDNLAIVRSGAASLLRLLDDLLETTLPESESREPRWEALSPISIAREAVELHAPLARLKGLVLDCRAAGDVPAWALGDARRLRLALTELVGIAGRSERGKSILIGVDRVADASDLVLRYAVRVEAQRPASSAPETIAIETIDVAAARLMAAKLSGRVDVDTTSQALVLRLVVPLRPAGLAAAADLPAAAPAPTAPVP